MPPLAPDQVFDDSAGDLRVQLVKLHANLLGKRFACNCLTMLRGAYLALFIFDTMLFLGLAACWAMSINTRRRA
jgi:hypothetical protein